MKFINYLFTTAIGLALAAYLLDGIIVGKNGIEEWSASTIVTLVFVALIFSFVNAFIKPVVKFFSCSLYLLTLGLFAFVVNALMLKLTSSLSGMVGLGFEVDNFLSAFLGSIIVSLFSLFTKPFSFEWGKPQNGGYGNHQLN